MSVNTEKMFELKELKKYFPVKRFLGGKKQYVKAVDGITMGKPLDWWENPAAANPPWDVP